jgi:F-type H+-transporting ATPase subunit alpha
MPVEEQVLALFAANRGFIDDIPVARVREFEKRLLDHMRKEKPDILAGIRTLGTLTDAEILAGEIEAFKKTF